MRAPTLVIHRTDDTGTPVEHGRYLAQHIPGATYVELPGEDHTFFLGEQQPMLDAILTFLDERVAGGALGSAVRRAERKNTFGYGWDSLTPSEREVAVLVAQGLTNSEVAERLRMSRYTVDGRLRRVYVKLDVGTRSSSPPSTRASDADATGGSSPAIHTRSRAETRRERRRHGTWRSSRDPPSPSSRHSSTRGCTRSNAVT